MALLAVAVFAYLVMHTARLYLSKGAFTKHESFYLVIASLLPVVTLRTRSPALTLPE